MSFTNEGGGGLGGGSTSEICIPSPSDMAQIADNLLHRIKLLEDAVSELMAANIMANQLSDLSQQVGWVDNITYAGVDGWSQTEYGSLVPPPGLSFSSLGFTLSDGNTYPMVQMDSDGVLQFGFTQQGTVEGDAVASTKDILVLGANSQTLTFNDAIVWTDELFLLGSSITWSGSTITLPSPGTYAISLQLISGSWNTPPAGTNSLRMRINTVLDSSNIPFMIFTDDDGTNPEDGFHR